MDGQPPAHAKYDRACGLLLHKRYDEARALFIEALAIDSIDSYCKHAVEQALLDLRMVVGLRPQVAAMRAAASPGQNAQVAAIAPQATHTAEGRPSIVFFHVDRGGDHPFLRNAPAVEYRHTLRIACEAALFMYAGAAVIVVTDLNSDVSYLPSDVHVMRLEMNPSHLMFERMRACGALAAAGVMHGPVAFLDTDVCLNQNPATVFEKRFDVALTYRTNSGLWHMPINEGVILASRGDTAPIVQFFTDALEIYDCIAARPETTERYGFDVRMWRGGQLSLAALVDWNTPPVAKSSARINGVRYLFLPCDKYNYTPVDGDTLNGLMSKWAVHFKGARVKDLMADYLSAAQKAGG